MRISDWSSDVCSSDLILAHRAKHMLGGLLRLIFVEQCHNLAHHDMHGIVAHFLRDGDELHAILRELADIELKLEMIAEEAGEAVDDHEVERRRLDRRSTRLNSSH